jgi:acetylornithine deacetylase/succinyl-diaminopimelate desuccinylase-like protein
MDLERLTRFIDRTWEDSILPQLSAYIRIPNKSPAFDPDWEAHGHMEQAVQLAAEWCRAQGLPGARIEIRRLPGRTPLLLVDIPGTVPGCVLLYGHLDKQPEFQGWTEGLSPWEPVLREGRLYGRGGADDGYAVFASVAAIAALQEQQLPHARCLLLIECCEESGSSDLPAHLAALGNELPEPQLVVCLDAECGNYEQLWGTTSLRGLIGARLTVRVLREGVHSGMGTGIAPTPLRILGSLLARIESPNTGELLLDELQVPIPPDRSAEMRLASQVLGETVAGKLPFVQGVQPLSNDPYELLVNSTWRATLAVIGADGFPPTAAAGNVLLPELTVNLSVRLPPTCEPEAAAAALRQALTYDPPYGAQVDIELLSVGAGWNAPPLAPWLDRALQAASTAIFQRPAVHLGCGGGIPFMGMLGARFPRAQFFITGLLGPGANAHGPNEYLHVPYAKRLDACVALVLAEQARSGA